MAVLKPVLPSAQPLGPFRTGLRHLFYGRRPAAVAFQAGLLALDIAALGYFLATTFMAPAPWIRIVDLLLGVLLLLEFLGRLAAHRQPMHYLDNASALIDVVVILSLFWSAFVGNLAFLRVLRTARLLRSYLVLGRSERTAADRPSPSGSDHRRPRSHRVHAGGRIDRLRHAACDQSGDQAFPRRPVLHRCNPLDHRLRRHHADWKLMVGCFPSPS